MKGIRVISSCFLMDILTLMCWAQGKAGQHIGSIVVVSGVNHSKNGENDASEPPPTPDSCKGYFDVMGQWDPPFNCSSGMFLYCCGTCGFRFCCQFRASKLDQDTCSNYDTPVWVNTNKPPPGPGPSIIDSTRNKTNLIVYIICGVVAVMVLVGIFTKLGLEKAHRPHREHMSRALADVMRQQAPNITEQTERDGNVVLPIQHYENIQPRTTTANNLCEGVGSRNTYCSLGRETFTEQEVFKRHILRTDQRKDNNPSSIGLTVPEIPQAKVIFPPYTPQMNNIVQTSPILPQMSHHHSYPSMGQLSHPYEPPQPAVKELNKYASLKAVDTPPVPLKQIQPWAHSVHQQRGMYILIYLINDSAL
ncbi:protein shisa-9 [Protopterus annectens]|uniref:protein shisa-9 n=1 Tax=Protopterus annectens TaxID=7888 RepID=UPI001CFA8CCB|nr:protein shisa-9 [Protopterus annectens]